MSLFSSALFLIRFLPTPSGKSRRSLLSFEMDCLTSNSLMSSNLCRGCLLRRAMTSRSSGLRLLLRLTLLADTRKSLDLRALEGVLLPDAERGGEFV